jgi:hypothetical protein
MYQGPGDDDDDEDEQTIAPSERFLHGGRQRQAGPEPVGSQEEFFKQFKPASKNALESPKKPPPDDSAEIWLAPESPTPPPPPRPPSDPRGRTPDPAATTPTVPDLLALVASLREQLAAASTGNHRRLQEDGQRCSKGPPAGATSAHRRPEPPPEDDPTVEGQLDRAFRDLELKMEHLVRKMLKSGQRGCFYGISFGILMSGGPSFLFIWFFLLPLGFQNSTVAQMAVMVVISFAMLCAGVAGSCGYVCARKRPATWNFERALRGGAQECVDVVAADRQILQLLHSLPAEARTAYLHNQEDDPVGLRYVYAQCRLDRPLPAVPTARTQSLGALVLKARLLSQARRELNQDAYGECWW